MAHFTQAVVAYTSNLSPNTVQAQMHSMFQGAVVDTSLAILGSVTLTADVTSNPSGTTVKRQLTYSLNTPPLLTTGLNTTGVPNVIATVESSSPNDNLAGVGAQQLNIAWNDAAGGAHNQTFNLTGQVPVAFGANNVSVITGFTLIAVGSFGANVGQLTIRTAAPTQVLPIMGGPVGGGYGPLPSQPGGIIGPGARNYVPNSIGQRYPGVGQGPAGSTVQLGRSTGRPTGRQGNYVPAGLAGSNRGGVLAIIPDSFYTRFPDTNNAAQVFFFQNWFLDGMMSFTGPTIQSIPVLS